MRCCAMSVVTGLPEVSVRFFLIVVGAVVFVVVVICHHLAPCGHIHSQKACSFQMSLVTGSFVSFLYWVIFTPVRGCTTGSQ